MKRKSFFLAFIFLSLVSFGNWGYCQEITRENYVKYLPLCPLRIISETEASRNLRLYDAPFGHSYQDSCLEDGIDDNRYKILRLIVDRFSPKLFWNTPYSIPLDFRSVINNEITPLLHVDHWDLTKADPSLKESLSVNLALHDTSECKESGLQIIGRTAFLHYSDRVVQHNEDCKLRALLEEFNPRNILLPIKLGPGDETLAVMYFDTPGKDEKSWKNYYKEIVSGKLSRKLEKYSKIYAHPFIHEELLDKKIDERYEFVIQYWLFYPFNDGGNNHEGDWEHLNVRITPKDKRNRLLNDRDIQEILDQKNTSIIENLVIKKVDYYFHHFVQILDYTFPDMYEQDSVKWNATIATLTTKRVAERRNWHRIRERLLLNEEEMHPLGFIGGDNKGLDQLISKPGGTNRDSHGTYPFPGLYKMIGPLGASEEIRGTQNISKALKDTTKYITYSRDQIEIIPDWERILDLVLTKSSARKKWSWLVLPILWGFPASKSPAAGIVGNADTGNLAPVGPAYNTGWNHVGDCKGYYLYEPHELSAEFPLDWSDNFKNDWGFLNLTFPALAIFPPFDFLWRVAPLSAVRAFTGRKNPIFYPKEALPFRRIAINVGFYPFFGDKDFARLITTSENIKIKELLTDQQFKSVTLEHTGTFAYKNIGLQMNFFLAGNFTSENLFRYSVSDIRYTLENTKSKEGRTISGNLQLIEYAGSFRYNFLRGTFQPYFKLGYGYSKYRVTNLRIVGGPELGATDWFHTTKFWPPWPPKNWLPNTGHIGIGGEFLINKNYSESRFPAFQFWKWRFGFPDLGVGIEYALFFHKLAAPLDNQITRHQLNFKFSISF